MQMLFSYGIGSWTGALKQIDPDLSHVIGRDGNLDQSHAYNLDQYSFDNTGPGVLIDTPNQVDK